MKKKIDARAGEFWSVNNSRTRGHKSLITKRRKSGVIEHIPITHTRKARHYRANIRLLQNPQEDDVRPAYILSRVQYGQIKELGKYHPSMRIKNKTDKSIIRKVKSRNKKR